MSFSSLLNYKRTLFALVIALRQLRDFSEKLDIENSILLLDDVLKLSSMISRIFTKSSLRT